MDASDRLESFKSALSQWSTTRDLVVRDTSLEQREMAATQALRDRKWWLVSLLLNLGVTQHQRDVAVYEAVKCDQWNCVEELVAAGISAEQRDFVLRSALLHGHWGLISRLLTLGVAEEHRNEVAREAVGQGQWDVVLAALRLGVAQNVAAEIFLDVFTLRLWKRVPGLMQHLRQYEIYDFIIRPAIKNYQWECVLLSIKIRLNPAQQELVGDEVLEQLHLERATKLVSKTIVPECAHGTVKQAFALTRWRDLLPALRAGGMELSVHEAVLTTDSETGGVNTATRSAAGATDKELTDVITKALLASSVGFIPHLVSLCASARRVVKCVLLKTRLKSGDAMSLHDLLLDDDPDLAFYVFVAQEMWECVVGMYEDVRLSARGRRFALRHAIRKQAWEWVWEIAGSTAIRPVDHQEAFLQAARQGQWRLALRLSVQSAGISDSDRMFALNLWLQLGLWQCVEDVLQIWVDPVRREKKLIECVLVESIIADKLESVQNICFVMGIDGIDERLVLQTALAYDRCSFVLEFCRRRKVLESFKLALELAIEHTAWILVADLMEDALSVLIPYDYSFDRFVCDYLEGTDVLQGFQLCLRSILQHPNSWQTVVPTLDAVSKHLTTVDTLGLEREEYMIGSVALQNLTHLVEWCLEAQHRHVAFLLSAMSNCEDLVTRVTDQLADRILPTVIQLSLLLAVCSNAWGSAFIYLQWLSKADARATFFALRTIQLSDLIEMCRDRGLYTWAVRIGAWTGDWDNLMTDLHHCQGFEDNFEAIIIAACSGAWDIARIHHHRLTPAPWFLNELLRFAVHDGELDFCKTLMANVDPSKSLPFHMDLLFFAAVTSRENKEEMVRLCIEGGLSTHVGRLYIHNCLWSPMWLAVVKGDLTLAKLLHKAGACSYQELFSLKHDLELRQDLENQGHHDVVQYVDRAASTPRTLQDLCRLRVSHLIGCRPGRHERVMSLDAPRPVLRLIKFNDILS